MEEKKGQNTLYLVIGVATLVVAIIGATFAYFSAQASSTTDIQGATNDVGASLTLHVNRVLLDKDGTANSNDLVPAKINVTTDGIAKAVNNKCVADGYTGCHLYKIEAMSDQDLDAANLLLQSFTTVGVTDTEAWKFVVFKGTESVVEEETTYTVTSLVTSAAEDFKNSEAIKTSTEGLSVHSTGMTANENYVYYLLVYLGDNDKVQNPTEEDSANAEYSATGTYSGSVILNAAGGKVVANFSASV